MKPRLSRRMLISGLIIIAFAAVVAFLSQVSAIQPEVLATSGPLSTTHVVTINNRNYIVEVAATDEQQRIGLSGRDSIPTNSGMLFPIFPAGKPPFWMKDMLFSIDIVWIAGTTVTEVTKNIEPPKSSVSTSSLPTYSPQQPADYALEVNAGEGQYFTIGDQIVITEIKEI